jgi:hypothetical protein
LGFELALWITDQNPAQRYGGQTRTVPDGSIRDDLHRALCAAVPAGYCDGRLDGGRIFGNNRKGGQALTFEAGPSYLPEAAWWSRLVEGGIQPQTGDEGDRISQLAATL